MDISQQLLDKKRLFISLFFMTAAFLTCYFPTLAGLFNIWMNDGDYSYALLIPLIAGYLIWERRKKVAATHLKTNWFGGLFFFLFLIISIYGILGSSPSAVRPAIPFIILSITLFCTGTQMFKVLAFPLSLFFLMIPLPTMVQCKIGVPLKRISTILGKWILRLFGISVFVEGNIIDLGITQLEVVNACSGLRYILPLLTIGILVAYFFEKSKWKQAILVISTIPISILINGIRIGVTGILTQYYGSKVAEGFFHGFSGWIVFMFAFITLFFLHFILKVLFKGKSKEEDSISNNNEYKGDKIKPKHSMIPGVITSSFLFLVAILGYSTAALPSLVIKGGLSSFSLSIKEWEGRTNFIDPEMVTLSGAEESFDALYQSNKGEVVSLYVGYRGSPFFENENFFHSPSICMPSMGWKVLFSATHEISEMPRFSTIRVRKMLVEKMNERNLLYYWFQTKNYTSCDVNINRWHLTVHALTRDNTHDLFIRLITPMGPEEGIEDAEERLDEFTREMTASLIQFLNKNQIEQGL